MRRLLLWLALAILAAPAMAQRKLESGRSTLEVADPALPDDRKMPVHLYVPKRLKADAPILFVIHGKKREAREYRETWIPQANEHDVLLVCPEFSEELFPSSDAFNIGNVLDSDGKPTDEARWTFSIIERLFDEIRERSGSEAETYFLYGHSAGAQFVHRLVLLLPEARVERAVAANAGWYTFPVSATAYPYGLGGLPDTEERLRRAFARDLVILLGEQDTDPDDPDLRTTPEAVAQGPHRLGRGQNFWTAGRDRARELGVDLRWRVQTVPGAGHSNADMARIAAELLFDAPKAKKKRG
jgi:poly(3-hydroxybutyrate) depolymerase